MSDSRGMSSYFCFHTYFCLHRIERQCDFRRIQSIFCDKCWKKIQNQTTEMCLPNPDAVFSRPDFSVTKNFKKLAPFYITFVYILCRALKQLTKSDKQYYLSTYVCLTTNRNNYVYTYLCSVLNIIYVHKWLQFGWKWTIFFRKFSKNSYIGDRPKTMKQYDEFHWPFFWVEMVTKYFRKVTKQTISKFQSPLSTKHLNQLFARKNIPPKSLFFFFLLFLADDRWTTTDSIEKFLVSTFEPG
jgi:hypothetical protein